jgi:nucleoside-diphosphate-sugar epimerase
MKAIVTGGTGFVGGKLVDNLIARGYHVRCLVRKTSKVEDLSRLGVELCYGDLSDLNSIRHATKGGDVVYHLAAHVSDWGPKEEFYKVNVEGTRNVLRASEEMNVKRLVYLSSSTVLWRSSFWKINNLTDIDESHPYPNSYNDPYNETKAEAEKLVTRYHKDTGLETVVIRASAVWGPGDTVILPRLAKAAKKGILFFIGRGDRWISPCYIENLVQALILAGEGEKAAGNVYFINDGIRMKHEHFVSRLLKTVGIHWSPRVSIRY